MKFYKLLALAAVGTAVAVGAGAAKADGVPGDPKVKIVVPTDPVIEPCADVDPSITCFTSNGLGNPVIVAGPTASQLNGGGTFDIVTNFIYEPTDCVGGVCPASDTLDQLFVAINPTIYTPATLYTCPTPTAAPGEEPAFNGCAGGVGVTPPPGSFLILELTCDSTTQNPCTGMLPGEEGSSEITPEPGEFAMLGIGILLVGLCGWKERKFFARRQDSLAAC